MSVRRTAKWLLGSKVSLHMAWTKEDYKQNGISKGTGTWPLRVGLEITITLKQ